MVLMKAVHVSHVPNHTDHIHVQENATLSITPSCFPRGSVEFEVAGGDQNQTFSSKIPNKFMIMGHRGNGMNMLQSSSPSMKAFKENTITSFNQAAKFHIPFIEFDVQVTKDGCPVIFHDIFIQTEHQGTMAEKRVTELTVEEFRSYGPQEESTKFGKPLFRKTNDGRMLEWKVEVDDHLCTLEEVLEKVDPLLGFNIELKFDDNVDYKEDFLVGLLQMVLQVVNRYAEDRPIIFSSFHPDAAVLMRKLQASYPVLFITKGGTEMFADMRRNSLEEAIKLCSGASLQGIVSDVKAIIRNPGIVTKIKQSKLLLLTYGRLNNVSEVVYAQKLLGIDGVIVDLVKEITNAVSDFDAGLERGIEEELLLVLKRISEADSDGVFK